jgi:hypothetical protein
MDDERMDFSPLDPSRDEQRWRRNVDALVSRALAERRRRLSIEQQLLHWARPMLAVAAGLCILAWTANLVGGSGGPTRETATNAPALTVANWAANHHIPGPDDLLGTLRGNP